MHLSLSKCFGLLRASWGGLQEHVAALMNYLAAFWASVKLPTMHVTNTVHVPIAQGAGPPTASEHLACLLLFALLLVLLHLFLQKNILRASQELLYLRVVW